MKTFAKKLVVASSVGIVSCFSLSTSDCSAADKSQLVQGSTKPVVGKAVSRPTTDHFATNVKNPNSRPQHVRPVVHVVRPIVLENSQPQVAAQPVSYPQDTQALQQQQPSAGDDTTPTMSIDTPGDAAIKEQQAHLLAEQARALVSENNLKQTEGLLAQKKLWSEDRSQNQLDLEARLEHGRQVIAERRRTTYRAVYRLSVSQLNPSTGAITWPAALQSDSFDQHRNHMNELFRQLVTYGDSRPAKVAEIASEVETWSRELGSEVGTIPNQDYLQARKFLTCLKYAAESLAEAT